MGAAHARALAREGATVAIADIAAEPASGSPTSCGPPARTRSYHDHDVTDAGAWLELVAAVERTHGPIDVLVNNAGVQVRSVGIEADDEEWAKVTAVNQRGVFLGMRAVIPGHGQRTGGGSIINIASVAALVGLAGSIPYQASKSAVLGLTRGAAVSYGPDNIRVNAICPGLVVTGDDRERIGGGGRRDEGADPAAPGRSSRGDLGGRRVPRLGRVFLHHRRGAADRRRVRRDLARESAPPAPRHRTPRRRLRGGVGAYEAGSAPVTSSGACSSTRRRLTSTSAGWRRAPSAATAPRASSPQRGWSK